MSGTIGYTGTGYRQHARPGHRQPAIRRCLRWHASGGTIYFEDNGDTRSLVRESEWPATETQLTARGIPWVYEDNTPGGSPQNRNNVSGAVTGLANLSLPNGSTYLPGSWADNLTSYGCVFGAGQTQATAFIAAGAAGTCGTVVEPYAISSRFTNSSIYTFIADGSTLAEAFAKSVQTPDTQMPLGDMLCQPYADVPKVSLTSGPAGYANVKGTISIAASAGLTNPVIATGIASLQLAVDGLLSSSGTVAGGSGGFTLNTATLSDGVHEIRVVGVNNAQAASEGYTAEEIVVNNHGRSINFNGGNLTMTTSAASINVAAAAGDGTVSQIELTCLGRVVATVAGSAGTISLSPTTFAAGTTTVVPNLAPGDNTIVPVAIYSDGMQVAGGAFVVHVETGPINAWANNTGNRLWSNPANWSGGVLPQNGDNVARFGGGTSGGTVTLDASATVQEIDFDNSGGGNYVLAASPGQAITLSTSNGVASECLISVNGGNHTISAPLVLATQGNLFTTTNPADSLTISGSISGIGSLTKTGSGTLFLTAANSYSGVTNVNCGTLQLGNTNALGSGPVAISTGVLDLAGYSPSVGALSGSGTITSSVAGQASLTTNVTSGTFTFSGLITNGAGTVSLIKSGSGTLILSGANTYTGGTTIGGGALQLQNTSALGSSSDALKVTSGTLDLYGNSPTIGALSGAGVITDSITTASTLTTSGGAAGTAAFTGAITNGTGNVCLTVSGSGKLILSGNNTLSGTTSVYGTATVVVTNPNAFGGIPWNVAPNGGASTLDLQCGSIPAGQVLINTPISPATGPDNYNQLGNFTIVTDATSPSSTGVTYAAGAATLAVANSTYTGNTANVGRTMTVSGGSNVNGGTAGLSFTSFQVDVQTTGTGTPYPSYYAPVTFNIQNPDGTGVTLLSIGTLNLSNQIVNGTNIGYGYGNLVLTGNGNFSVTSGLTGGTSTAASLTLGTGYTGTANFAGTLSYVGSTIISGGKLIFGASPSSSTFVVNTNNSLLFSAGLGTVTLGGLTGSGNVTLSDQAGSPAAVNMTAGGTAGGTYSGNLTGLGGFTKAGANLLVFSGANSYSGSTTVSSGTLEATVPGALPGYNSAGKISVAAVAGLYLPVGNSSSYWQPADVANFETANSGAFAATSSLILDTTAANVTLTTPINGSMNLYKIGTNALTLSGNSGYTGNTILSAGTLTLGSNSALGANTGSGTLALSGTLDMNGFSVTVGSLAGAGYIVNNNTPVSTLTTNVISGTGAFTGVIKDGSTAGNMAFTKTGAGLQVLELQNTFTGPVTVNQGILSMFYPNTNYNTAGMVKVAAGATYGIQIRIGLQLKYPTCWPLVVTSRRAPSLAWTPMPRGAAVRAATYLISRPVSD